MNPILNPVESVESQEDLNSMICFDPDISDAIMSGDDSALELTILDIFPLYDPETNTVDYSTDEDPQ